MLIFFAALCGLTEAIFTALEVALGGVSRARLRALSAPRPDDETSSRAQVRRALVACRIVERPDRLALLFITVTSLSLWGAATFLTWAALSQGWPGWGLPLALVAVLFVAEVLPLQIAARHSEVLALRGAGLVSLALRVLAPVTSVVGGVAYGVARAMGSGPGATPHVTEGELRTALAAAEEEGVIESEERALIEGAMDFRDKVVREVMTPRIDIVGVPAAADLAQTLEIALREGHSRLPVFDGTLDNIVGVLATKDLLPHLTGAPANAAPKTARDVARPPFFVPQTKKIASTLEELRRQRTLLAVVVDADGGTAGLVTLEDLLEELVGEIQDEYDLEEPPLRVVGGETALLCDAATTVREWGRFWAHNFAQSATLRGADGAPAASGQSLAALALELFQNVPRAGDCIRAGEAVALSVPSHAARDAAEESGASEPRVALPLEMKVIRMAGPRIEEVKIALAAS